MCPELRWTKWEGLALEPHMLPPIGASTWGSQDRLVGPSWIFHLQIPWMWLRMEKTVRGHLLLEENKVPLDTVVCPAIQLNNRPTVMSAAAPTGGLKDYMHQMVFCSHLCVAKSTCCSTMEERDWVLEWDSAVWFLNLLLTNTMALDILSNFSESWYLHFRMGCCEDYTWPDT